MKFLQKHYLLAAALLMFAAAAFTYGLHFNAAFAGPSGTGGVGSGLFIASSGNIGIGNFVGSTTRLTISGSTTDSSAYALQVVDSGNSPLLFIRNDGKTTIGTSTVGTNSILKVYGKIETATGTNPGGIIFSDGTTQTSAGGSSVNAANVSAGNFGSIAGVGTYTFPSTVSIGTTTAPGGQLDVWTSNTAGNPIAFLLDDTSTQWYFALPRCSGCYAPGAVKGDLVLRAANTKSFLVTTNNGSNTAFVISSSSNVGIGVTAPSAKLDISSSATYPIATLKISGAGADLGLELKNTSAAGHDYYLFSAGTGSGLASDFRIYDATAGTDRLYINSTGVVTIPNRVTGLSTPTGSSDAATKGYVDSVNVAVRWAGYSTSTYDGRLGYRAGVYTGVAANKAAAMICNNLYAGSHWAMQNEVLALGTNYPWSTNAWLQDGSSCSSWGSNSSGVTGNYANSAGYITATACSTGFYLPCVY